MSNRTRSLAAVFVAATGHAGFASTVDRDVAGDVTIQTFAASFTARVDNGRSTGATPGQVIEILPLAVQGDFLGDDDDGTVASVPVVVPTVPIVEMILQGRSPGTVTPVFDPTLVVTQPTTTGGGDLDQAQLAAVTAVPVPAAGILLFAGLGMLFGFGRRAKS